MNRQFHLGVICIFFLILISCGKKRGPNPDEEISEEIIEQDSSVILPTSQFYELEESIEDIQRQISQLQTQVMEYEYKPSETNYTEKLKELINDPPPKHKIILANGSVIEGTIIKDRLDNIMIKTDVGKLIIQKNEIENIEDLIIPSPNIIFIGHGQDEIIDNYHLFTGKVVNQGSRRGDFVRVIYNLWGEDTQLIISDSAFVGGTQIIYQSGIVTDTVLEPNQSAHFSIQISVEDTISVSYVTREVHWSIYD